MADVKKAAEAVKGAADAFVETDAEVRAKVAAAEEAAAKAEGLVKMVLDDVVSFVHATCVEAHELVGWVRKHFS